MQLVFILGRIPTLAQREIEAVVATLPLSLVASMVQPDVLLLKSETDSNELPPLDILKAIFGFQQRLGGTLKIVLIDREVKLNGVASGLRTLADKSTQSGRLEFGISVYGSVAGASSLGLGLKKALKASGASARYVQPKEGQAMSTAQVWHNHLAYFGDRDQPQNKGREFVIIQSPNGALLGYTLTVQNIDAYAKRDFELPQPDAVSGMLPPKLAQTMVNLATQEAKTGVVYDPFCGNGRVVMEAALMGFESFGSDISPEKVSASQANLKWAGGAESQIWLQDATQPNAIRQIKTKLHSQDLYVVAEPYLGKPLRAALTESEANDWLTELEELYVQFFTVWSKAELKPKRMIIVFPKAKKQGHGSVSLYNHLIDRLTKLGYTSSVLACYERPDSFVARDIVQVS